jgi:transcriptional regulator with XRE-family HTH domain
MPVAIRLQGAFGAVLKELRAERGLSQHEVALDSGLDRTYISLMERGLRQPSLGTIFQLAQSLRVLPGDLVARVERRLATRNEGD